VRVIQPGEPVVPGEQACSCSQLAPLNRQAEPGGLIGRARPQSTLYCRPSEGVSQHPLAKGFQGIAGGYGREGQLLIGVNALSFFPSLPHPFLLPAKLLV
jgi:hypothetical protein